MNNLNTIISLLRRLLDPACEIGEATNAATKLVIVARRDRVDFKALVDAILPVSRRMGHQAQDGEPLESKLRLSFGKYKGKTLGEIARIDRSYLKWLSTEVTDSLIRSAAASVYRRECENGGNNE